MALIKRVALPPRAVRQLRRIRSYYLVGIALSLLALVQGGSPAAPDRGTLFAGGLLAVFVVLLALTVVQLWRHARTPHCATARRLTRSV